MNTPRMNVLLAGIFLGTAFAGTLRGVTRSSVGDFQQAGAFTMPPPAGPNRPANVPDGYVITPVGYFHPSCVQSLAKGETTGGWTRPTFGWKHRGKGRGLRLPALHVS
jgi:hypothetical protein